MIRKSSFYRWLLKQVDRDDPIADLSDDIQRDKVYPVGTNSLEKLREHLILNRACPEAIQALEEAHAEFRDTKNSRSGLPVGRRFEIFRRDDYRCQICGVSSSEGGRLEVDHKIPLSKGGCDEETNLWTLCFECNRGKGAKGL